MVKDINAIIIGAIAGVIGGLTVAVVEGVFTQETALEVEKAKLQSGLIQASINTDDPRKSLKALQFLVDLKLVPLYADQLKSFLEGPNVEERTPALQESLPPYKSPSQLTTLQNIRYRLSTQITGMLVAQTNICTAWLYDTNKIGTSDVCVPDSPLNELWEFRLGYKSFQEIGQSYQISRVIEKNEVDGYALLELSDEATSDLRHFDKETRIPKIGEKLYVVHHPDAQPMVISDEDCFVVAIDENGGFMDYKCRTDGGSGGAIVWSQNDSKPLGVHFMILDKTTNEKRARLFGRILNQLQK